MLAWSGLAGLLAMTFVATGALDPRRPGGRPGGAAAAAGAATIPGLDPGPPAVTLPAPPGLPSSGGATGRVQDGVEIEDTYAVGCIGVLPRDAAPRRRHPRHQGPLAAPRPAAAQR